jgi:hypothetical protein
MLMPGVEDRGDLRAQTPEAPVDRVECVRRRPSLAP